MKLDDFSRGHSNLLLCHSNVIDMKSDDSNSCLDCNLKVTEGRYYVLLCLTKPILKIVCDAGAT